jgi:hypothetical protein
VGRAPDTATNTRRGRKGNALKTVQDVLRHKREREEANQVMNERLARRRANDEQVDELRNGPRDGHISNDAKAAEQSQQYLVSHQLRPTRHNSRWRLAGLCLHTSHDLCDHAFIPTPLGHGYHDGW